MEGVYKSFTNTALASIKLSVKGEIKYENNEKRENILYGGRNIFLLQRG